MAHIGDIIISRIVYDNDRFRTARHIAEMISEPLSELNLTNFFSSIRTIDIPTSTKTFHETCLAFIQLEDSRDHQMFVDKFNSRITFRGKKIIMRLSAEKPKGRCANYELAWTSYPRSAEPRTSNNQSSNVISKITMRRDNDEPSRAYSEPREEPYWSEGEDMADAGENKNIQDKATIRKQAKKLFKLADELKKCQSERDELAKKLKEAVQGRERAEMIAKQLEATMAAQSARLEAIRQSVILQ